MDATLHTLIVSQYMQDRIAEATSERAARDLKPRRRLTRKARPEAPPNAVARSPLPG